MARQTVKRSPVKYKRKMSTTFALAMEQASKASTVPQALALLANWAQEAFADARHKVSPETRKKIEHLAQEGYAAHHIAGVVDLSPPTVRKVLGARKKK